jgi:vacuolar-type H+-ATPase subunit I/STV1
VFNASKLLFSLSDQAGNTADAVKYARIFVNENNTLNMGKRQELAATVNNQYQYHRNQREEQQLKAENSRNRSLLFMVILCSVLLMTALLLYVFYKKNRRLKTQVWMQNELLQLKKDKSELEQEIDQQQTQIELLKEDLHAKENQMNHYLSEIERYDRDSAEKEKELKEKIEQNQSLIGMLNQLQFTVSNEDIIQKVKKASFGQYKMTTDDWNAFCGAIDMLYPTFKGDLVEKLGKFNRNQMLVCYLMRIGINPPQIQQLLNLPKTTVWRWVTRYKEVLKSEWISASGS